MEHYHALYLHFVESRSGYYGYAAVLAMCGEDRFRMWTGIAPGNDEVATTKIVADIVSALGLREQDHLTLVAEHGITTEIREGWTIKEFTPGGFRHKTGPAYDNHIHDAAILLAEWAVGK